MKKLAYTLLLSLFFAVPIMAGGGHSHGKPQKPISSEQAGILASGAVKQLVDAGSIDTSWAEVEVLKIEQKTFSYDPEWVITFSNSKISDPAEQTLYLFFSLSGDYIAANYSGT